MKKENFVYSIETLDVTPMKKESTSTTTPTVIDDSLKHDDYFNVRSMVTLEDLFK